MSFHSHFFRFWTIVFSAVILFVPLGAQAAKPVEKTSFTKTTISSTPVFEREIKSCAPTSNVTPRSNPDCSEVISGTRETDNEPHYGIDKTVDTDTVDCADLEGLASGEPEDVSDVTGVVNDGGDIHFDLSLDYGAGYDAYEACISTTSATSQGSTYFPAKGWAWDDNLGWVSFVCDSTQFNTGISCGDYEYKTKINTTTGVFSGYAWGDGTGWLQFNWDCPAGYSADQCNEKRVKLDFTTGELSGWAWSDNVGWFDFSGVNVNSFDLSSLWQTGTTVNWTVEVYYGKPYTELFADCSDSYKVHVKFLDPTTGTYVDPESYGYTVSVSDWAEDDTIEYDQVDSGQWTSTTYGTADCPVNSSDVTDWQTYDLYHYTLQSFTVTVLDGTTVKLQKAFEWTDGSFEFNPVVTTSNFCIDYGGEKQSYVLSNNTNKETSADLYKRSSATSLSNVSITQKLFSSSNSFVFTGGTSTEETQTVTFSGDTYTYTENVDIGTDGGDSCTVVTYSIIDPDEGSTEYVEYPGQPMPRYTAYGVGIPFFEAKGTENTTAADVDVAKVTRNTLYTALKKVVGASDGKSGGGTLQNGAGSDSKNDLDGSARSVNSDAEFLDGVLLYFTDGDVTFDDDNNSTPVPEGMTFTDAGTLVSGGYSMTWTDPVTVVVEGGDIYIDENLWGDTPIGLISLDDGSGGGHIYIDKNVTNVKAVMYADHFVTSYDTDDGVDADGQPVFSTTTRADALGNQLYVVGSIVSPENNADSVDTDSDSLYSDGEMGTASAENFNWMREFKLYPGTTDDGNPEDYDGDGEIEDCSDGFDGFPYLDPTGNNEPPCDGAWILGGDLIVDDEHRLAAGVTDGATTLDDVEDLLPFYLYYQAPSENLPIFRSIGAGGAVSQ